MSHFLYILYSEKHDKFYIGQTDNIEVRLLFHNEISDHSYTSRFRPWSLKLALAFSSRSHAMRAEKAVKARKSRTYLEELINSIEKQNQLYIKIQGSAGLSGPARVRD